MIFLGDMWNSMVGTRDTAKPHHAFSPVLFCLIHVTFPTLRLADSVRHSSTINSARLRLARIIS